MLTVTWRDVTERFDALKRYPPNRRHNSTARVNIGEVVVRVDDDDTIARISASVERVLQVALPGQLRRALPSMTSWLLMDQPADGGPPGTGEAISGARLVHELIGAGPLLPQTLLRRRRRRGRPRSSFRVIDDEVAMERWSKGRPAAYRARPMPAGIG